MLKKFIVYLLSIYKKHLSHTLVYLLGGSCRLIPTCSEYGITAIQNHGILKGSYITIKRIVRCNPFTKVSFDPVP